MAVVKFSKQIIEPNPLEVDYWVDIESDPYGSVWKYHNGTSWVSLNLNNGSNNGGLSSFDYYTKEQVNSLLSGKADVDSVESKVDDAEFANVIQNIEFREIGDNQMEMVLLKYDNATVGVTIPMASETNPGMLSGESFRDFVKQSQLQSLYDELYQIMSELSLAENERNNAEQQRNTNENDRIAAETNRLNSENIRQSEEQNRISNEILRETAENDRNASEVLRKLAEEIRSTTFNALKGKLQETIQEGETANSLSEQATQRANDAAETIETWDSIVMTTEEEGDVNDPESDVVNEAIRKTPQTLSKAEQSQARKNIGAASLDEINNKVAAQDNVIDDFKESITNQVNNYKPIEINGDVTNAADEEDLTSENGLLKLKDRSALNGMGHVILRKNKTFAEQVTLQNTIYEIRYDFDLNGAEVTIPEGCTLDFQGGSFSNGYIIFNNTYIDSNYVVFNGCKIGGKVCNINILSDWFDLDSKFENTLALRGNGKTLVFNPSETLNVDKKTTYIIQSNFSIKNLHVNLSNVNPLFLIGTDREEEPTKDILIENCCIESDSKDSNQIFLLKNSENITIRNNRFKNVGYCIIQSYGYSSNKVTVEGNIAEECTADFIECNCTSSAISYDWIIRDNKYYGSINYPKWDDTHTENRFIGVTAVKNIIITNNFAEKSAKDSMIHLEDVGGELVLTGNVLKNPIGYFIWFINNAFQKCIISNNIFEIDDNNCCGKGSYANSSYAPYFISSDGNEYRTEEILVSNNIFIGKNLEDNYYGVVNSNGLIIKNNIFDNIFSISGLRTKVIEGNYFKGCLNCFKIKFSGIEKGLRYINNIDVDTKDYSIYIESNNNQPSYYNNPVITNNKISGKVRIGEAHNIVFNDNICDLLPDKININLPGSQESTVSQNNNNIFNFIDTSINYPSISIEKGVNSKFNGLGYYKNNIYKAYNNQWYNLNSAFVSDSNPTINNIGATVFRTDLGKPIICKSIGKRQIFKFSILGTPSDNGSITFSQENISVTVPTYIDDSIEYIIKRIFAIGIPGTISYTHDNASISVLDITTLNREPPIIECSDSNLSCKFSKIDFATNSVYVEADGAIAGVLRVGTFSEKPLSDHIYVGFEYFCIDKQTVEGGTDGIMIYHKGNDIWVDALGRVVN